MDKTEGLYISQIYHIIVSKLKSNKPYRSFIISFLLVSIELTSFLFLFEFAFFSLLLKMENANFSEFWILQILIFSIFALCIICSYQSRLFRIGFSIFVLIFSIIISIISLICLKSLLTLKLILGALIAYSLIIIIYSIRSHNSSLSKIKTKPIAIILLIISSSLGITAIVSFSSNKIEIDPKSEPEIIFWCGSNQLPDEPDILEMCKEYNIGFMPTIRSIMLGNDEYIQKYKNITAYGINLYFCIGGDSGFFANIDNAHEFPIIYEEIREWFINESILSSPYIKSFCVDAEPPKEFSSNMDKEKILDSMEYGSKNYPTRKEIELSTEAMKEFKESVERDGKKCGMIRASQLLDSSDGDDDLSLFARNIYNLDVDWDYTITMLYRTNRLQDDESQTEPSRLYTKSLSILFGSMVEGTKITNSELNFYQNVALEQSPGDTKAKHQYIFIGNFDRDFKETEYIKEKKYKKDLDICRHFNEKKVFFYYLKGFVRNYGWEGIEELGRHNQQKDKWYLIYKNNNSITFFLFYCGLIFIDIFVFFEKDLT